MAFHLVADRESGHDWSSVEYDPIGEGMSIGIIQEYAYNIKPLMQIIDQNYPDVYKQHVPTQYQSDLLTRADDDWPGWRWPDDLWQGVKALIDTDQGRASQIAHWNQLVSSYTSWLDNHGYKLDSKAWIYFISMYHQSPSNAIRVIDSVGGTSPRLEQLHNARARNSVLKAYSNRYNWQYQQLNAWDGESAPTDGCDISKTAGIDWGGSSSGGSGVDNGSTGTGIGGTIIQVGDNLYLLNGGSKTQFTKIHGQMWTRNGSAFQNGAVTGTPNPDGSFGNGNSNCDTVTWARTFLQQWHYIYGGARDLAGAQAAGGTDCSGFASIAFQVCRNVFIGWSTEDQSQSNTQVDVATAHSWGEVPWNQMRCGDLIYMTRDSSNYIPSGGHSHVAIYTGTGTMVVDAGGGNIPKERDITTWSNPSFIKVRRVPEASTVTHT